MVSLEPQEHRLLNRGEPTPSLPLCFLQKGCENENDNRLLYKYIQERQGIINDSLLDRRQETPLKVVDINNIMDISNSLFDMIEQIRRQIKPTVNTLIASLNALDSELKNFHKKLVTKNQPGIFFSFSNESALKYKENDIWMNLMIKFLADLFRNCMIFNDDTQEGCDIDFPYKDDTSISIFHNLIRSELPGYMDSESAEYKILSENMKQFLKKSVEIINFLIDNFFDETQSQFEGRPCRFNSGNDEDLQFLAEFLFSYTLPAEMVDGYLKYTGSSGDAFKNYRGNLVLNILKLMQVMEQVLGLAYSKYDDPLILHERLFTRENSHVVTYSRTPRLYVYNKGQKDLFYVSSIKLSFVNSELSYNVGYNVIQWSFNNISNGADMRDYVFYDFFDNNDILFDSLESFFKTPSVNKIREKLSKLGIKIPDELSLNSSNNSASVSGYSADVNDSESISEETPNQPINPEDYKEILELLFKNRFLKRFSNLLAKFREKYYLVSNNIKDIKAALDLPDSNDYMVTQKLLEVDQIFHTSLLSDFDISKSKSLAKKKLYEQHKKNFDDIISELLKNLSTQIEKDDNHDVQQLDLVLVVERESISSFFDEFFQFTTDTYINAFVISFVCDEYTKACSIYLGNNKRNGSLPELLDKILSESPDFLKILNGRNLYIVVVNTSVTNIAVQGSTRGESTRGNIAELLERLHNSVTYVIAMIQETFLINKMVEILVQNCKTDQDHNQRINLFAKLLFIQFLKANGMFGINMEFEKFVQSFAFFGLSLIHNPKYLPELGWKEIISPIQTAFSAEKELLYNRYSVIRNNSKLKDEFESFKAYSDKFSKQRIDSIFSMKHQRAATRYAQAWIGMIHGGGYKTQKSGKYNKHDKVGVRKTMKKIIKKNNKNNKNQSRKVVNIKNNKSKKLKQKNKK
jgi:hypothetical protein